MNQLVAIAHRDYLSMESRLYEVRSQKSRLILIFIIITFIIIAASAITLLLYWIRLKNKESEVQLARISGLMKEIDGLKESGDGDDGFLKETWNLVGKMYEELMESIDGGGTRYIRYAKKSTSFFMESLQRRPCRNSRRRSTRNTMVSSPVCGRRWKVFRKRM